jgi:hypothetical protein
MSRIRTAGAVLSLGAQREHKLPATRCDLGFEIHIWGESRQAIKQPLGGLIGVCLGWATSDDFSTTLASETLDRFEYR